MMSSKDNLREVCKRLVLLDVLHILAGEFRIGLLRRHFGVWFKMVQSNRLIVWIVDSKSQER